MSQHAEKPVWDGVGLPPVGADVIFNTSSSGDVMGTVTGYYTLPSLSGGAHNHRVFVDLVYKCTDVPNCRLLGDVKPLPKELQPESRACRVRRPWVFRLLPSAAIVAFSTAILFGLAWIDSGLYDDQWQHRAIVHYFIFAAIIGIADNLRLLAAGGAVAAKLYRNARARRLLATDSLVSSLTKE